MDGTERDKFKHELRAIAAGRADGIDLDSPERWVIEDLKDAIAFFRHLDKLVPTGSILYFEGCEIVPEVARFYESKRAANAVFVVRDTIFPVPNTFHVSMTPAVLAGIIDLLSRHPLEKCFYHVKAYREEKLLFTFHDAFDGSPFLVSDRIPETCVRELTSTLGLTYRRESNVNKRDPEMARRLLWAMENPEKIRMFWPWWKKLLFFWKK